MNSTRSDSVTGNSLNISGHSGGPAAIKALLEKSNQELSHLEQLTMRENGRMSALPANPFSCMTSLTDIDLSRNKITSSALADSIPVLAQLPVLCRLDLNHNEIGHLPATISKLAALQVLDVCSNQLRKLPVELGAIDSLYVIDFSGNKIEWPTARVLDQGDAAVLAYLRSQLGGGVVVTAPSPTLRKPGVPPPLPPMPPVAPPPLPGAAQLSPLQAELQQQKEARERREKQESAALKSELSKMLQVLQTAEASMNSIELQQQTVQSELDSVRHQLCMARTQQTASQDTAAGSGLSVTRAMPEKISRAHLDQIRSLKRPPPAVQACLEAVWLLLYGSASGGACAAPGVFGPDQQKRLDERFGPGEDPAEQQSASKDSHAGPTERQRLASQARKNKSSKVAKMSAVVERPKSSQVLSMLGSDKFISSVESFDPQYVMLPEHEFLSLKYMSRADELDDAVARACTACTPLWSWVQRQHHSASLLLANNKEAPLLDLATLEQMEQNLMKSHQTLNERLDDAEDVVSVATKNTTDAQRAVQHHKSKCVTPLI